MNMAYLLKDIAYGALDRVTRGRGVPRTIHGEVIRFPARWSRYYERDYEPATFEFLREQLRPGDAVLDLGAHIGLFSVSMARMVGPTGSVYSFEPTPLTRSVLEETVRLNGCSSVVRIRGEAAAGTTGEATFFDTGDAGSNANSLITGDRMVAGTRVATVAVDEFVEREGLRIRLLKVDVEGAELDVLRGAYRTLMRDRPALSLGLHPESIRRAGGTLDDIWQLLQDARMAVQFEREPVTADWFCRQTLLFDVQARPRDG